MWHLDDGDDLQPPSLNESACPLITSILSIGKLYFVHESIIYLTKRDINASEIFLFKCFVVVIWSIKYRRSPPLATPSPLYLPADLLISCHRLNRIKEKRSHLLIHRTFAEESDSTDN